MDAPTPAPGHPSRPGRDSQSPGNPGADRHDAADRFALLEARHVDALTAAVRSLNANIAKLVALSDKQLQATSHLSKSVCELSDLLRPKDAAEVAKTEVTPSKAGRAHGKKG